MEVKWVNVDFCAFSTFFLPGNFTIFLKKKSDNEKHFKEYRASIQWRDCMLPNEVSYSKLHRNDYSSLGN